MKPWSKLQKELYNLITDDINFQIHCAVYRMQSQNGSTDLPRYWITIDKEIVWDYPKQFIVESKLCSADGTEIQYPYENEISDISNLIREYIDTPKGGLFEKHFENDHWQLTDFLKAADRRIGISRIKLWNQTTQSEIVQQIINQRINKLHLKV